jgi:hypothetical protein
MAKTLESVRQAFSQQCAGVLELLEFDDFLVGHLVGGLDWIVGELESRNHHTLATSVGNRLSVLKNVRADRSLRPRYQTIYNQCVVLLVSYFDATMSDVFKVAVSTALKANAAVPARKRSVQLNWQSLNKPDSPVEILIAERIVEEDDISFQDMQSIRRAFNKELGIDLARDEHTNDIILGQACRHVMAHAGGRVDDRLMNQISGANPRRLKASPFVHGDYVAFNPEEVRSLSESMLLFVGTAVEKCSALSASSSDSVV